VLLKLAAVHSSSSPAVLFASSVPAWCHMAHAPPACVSRQALFTTARALLGHAFFIPIRLWMSDRPPSSRWRRRPQLSSRRVAGMLLRVPGSARSHDEDRHARDIENHHEHRPGRNYGRTTEQHYDSRLGVPGHKPYCQWRRHNTAALRLISHHRRSLLKAFVTTRAAHSATRQRSMSIILHVFISNIQYIDRAWIKLSSWADNIVLRAFIFIILCYIWPREASPLMPRP